MVMKKGFLVVLMITVVSAIAFFIWRAFKEEEPVASIPKW